MLQINNGPSFVRTGFLALALLASCFSNAMIIERESLSLPREIENVSIIHENNSFTIEDQTGAHVLQPYQMSSELRNIPTNKLATMLTAGSYLKVNKALNDASYSIDLQQRVIGGGAAGAWWGFYTGKFLTHLVAQAAIGAVGVGVSIVATPAAGWVVVAALEKTTLVPVEYVSNVVGVGTGILGAVASGPA